MITTRHFTCMPRTMKKRHGNLNISGLRNQKQSTASDPDLVHTENDVEDQETPKDFRIQFDSTRIDWANSEGNADEESDDEEVLKIDAYGDEQFTLQMAALAEEYDPMDQDWVPAKYRGERQVKKGERNKTNSLKMSLQSHRSTQNRFQRSLICR